MISFIEGTLIDCGPDRVVLATGGVGFDIQVPARSIVDLPPPGETARLHTYLHVREDVLQLYGFAHPADRELFLTLLSVGSVGPSLALAVLSGMSVEAFCDAVLQGNEAALRKIQGVGPKVAKRLVFELAERVKKVDRPAAPSAAIVEGGSIAGDAVAALMALGCKPAVAERAVERALEETPAPADTGALVRIALKYRTQEG